MTVVPTSITYLKCFVGVRLMYFSLFICVKKKPKPTNINSMLEITAKNWCLFTYNLEKDEDTKIFHKH